MKTGLTGVSVYKAHNDLSTLSYQNKDSNNPFFNNIKNNWSKYTLNFTIPNTYNSASDWVLKIHGGKWGWRQNNSFTAANDSTATNTQEIYLDEISLSSNTSTSTVLLSSNSRMSLR